MTRTDDLAGRTVLITGGTGGVGLEAARMLHARGARLAVGSREPARYDKVAQELGGTRISPFIADLRDATQVNVALEALVRDGLSLTDIVHSAAGGMEPVLRTLTRVMTAMRRLEGAELDAAHEAAIAELAPLVDQSREHALETNFRAPVRLLDHVAPNLPRGGTVTFYSHFWASLYPNPQIPIYYRAVAESKHELETWLAERASEWGRRGLKTAVISSSVIADTRMGYLLDRFCAEMMPPSDREMWRATFVNASELVDATIALMDGSGETNPTELAKIFITAPGIRADHLDADADTMRIPVVLAANARKWTHEGAATAQ